jgi:predicted RNA-binding Zn ribbon-like protein
MGTSRFLFLEGNPAWLDFVNTELVLDGAPADLLPGFRDVVDWLREARFLAAPGAVDALAARNDGARGGDALRLAREFRRTLRSAAERLGRGESFPPSAVRAVNDVLALGAGSYRLQPSKTGFAMAFESVPQRAEELLVPLARSLAEFLTVADLGRVKKCDNPKCVLYFYDATKNQARRWCSMAFCGNRMKAALHYRRTRGNRS